MKCSLFFVSLLTLGVAPQLAGRPAGFPYYEGFDSLSPPALPSGWVSTQHRTPGQNDFVTATGTPRSLPHALLSTNATIEQSLVSPLFDFLGVNPDRLSFYTRRSLSHQARLVVEASLDSGRTYTAKLGDTLTNTGQSSYVLSSVALPDTLGNSGCVRFRWRIIPDVTGATGTLRIDDISITVKNSFDLELSDLRTVPLYPSEYDSVTVVALVRNTGIRRQQGFRVDLAVDANHDSLPQPSEQCASILSSGLLEAGDSVNLVASLGILPAGEQLLIGDLSTSEDQNLSNNRRVANVSVRASGRGMVINELQYAPAIGEPEWMELYNTTAHTVNLTRWSITDNNISIKHAIGGTDVFVPAGGFVVLTKDSAALAETRPGHPHPFITMPGFPSLNNTGDAVVLFDANGRTVDSLSYLPTWGGGSGRSLERIDAYSPSADSVNWSTCEDSTGGTPGERNTVAALEIDLRLVRATARSALADSGIEIRAIVQNAGKRPSDPFGLLVYDDTDRDSLGTPAELVCSLNVSRQLQYRESLAVAVQWIRPPPGVHQVIAVVEEPRDLRQTNNAYICSVAVSHEAHTIVINEIMYAPLAGNTEYIELMNCSQHEIDLLGWKLFDRTPPGGNSNKLIITRERRIVHPGELCVVAADSTILSLFHDLRETDPRLLSIMGVGSLNLNNEGDDIVVRDGSDMTIDSVAFLSGWHNPGVVDPDGRSLERIRPAGGSNDAHNWSTSANTLGGTPGRQNSVYTPTLPMNARLTISPNPFSPDGDGIEDFSLIQYEVPLQVSMVCIRIFDVKGRLIRRLVNNEPSGAHGSAVWDGRDEERQKARVGLYVVLVEALNERQGVLESAKGIIVLAAQL